MQIILTILCFISYMVGIPAILGLVGALDYHSLVQSPGYWLLVGIPFFSWISWFTVEDLMTRFSPKTIPMYPVYQYYFNCHGLGYNGLVAAEREKDIPFLLQQNFNQLDIDGLTFESASPVVSPKEGVIDCHVDDSYVTIEAD